jgi:hypothetical protein
MGRSIKPKYVMVMEGVGLSREPMAWRRGRVSAAKAEEERVAWNKSYAPGGVNWPVSEAIGVVPHVSRLIVRENRLNGRVVAVANAPLFEVV